MFALVFRETHAQVFPVQGFAIKTADRGPGFMSFHLNKPEPLAFAGKDIRGNLDGPHGSVCGKCFTDGFL